MLSTFLRHLLRTLQGKLPSREWRVAWLTMVCANANKKSLQAAKVEGTHYYQVINSCQEFYYLWKKMHFCMWLAYNNCLRLEVCQKFWDGLLYFHTQIFLKLWKSRQCDFEYREKSRYIVQTSVIALKCCRISYSQ